MRLAALLILLSAFPARGSRVIVESFNDLTRFDTAKSTAVWNLATGELHLPFVVDRADGGSTEDEAVDIGNGSDGPFGVGTYPLFDTDGDPDNGIVLLTTGIYQFTTFDLAPGNELRGTGSNPLIIRVQGDATVSHEINLEGNNGTAMTGDNSVEAPGGSACCGGGNGGSGGMNVGAGLAGAGTGGGLGGDGDVVGDNGGGGGFGSAGTDGTANPGSGGSTYGTPLLTTLQGGSGGGGGGSANASNGGGGGAGGGAFMMEIGGNLDVQATGALLASGGTGGGGPQAGGGGGGGSGGALKLFIGGTLNNDGNMLALGGLGGDASVNDGGTGGNGRVRYVTTDGIITGTGNENPANPAGAQLTFYTVTERVVHSRPYDTGSSAPSYLKLKVDTDEPNVPIELQMAGSDDNFQSDTTGYITIDLSNNPASLSGLALEGKRYFRWLVKLRTTDRTDTPRIYSLEFTIEDAVQALFEFTIQGCAAVHGAPTGRLGFFTLLLYLLLLPFFSYTTRRVGGSRRA